MARSIDQNFHARGFRAGHRTAAARFGGRRRAEETGRRARARKSLRRRGSTAATQRVAEAKEKLAANQDARRAIEKEVAVHQGRLSKYRDQAMAVKTNQEYHAIQHEIAHAQGEIKNHEDGILERMVEADELTATIKAAEAELAASRKRSTPSRKRCMPRTPSCRRARSARRRARRAGRASTSACSRPTRRSPRSARAIAVAEANDGICTVCHVRMRPQMFNEVRRNETIVQCDSCQRILYAPPAAPTRRRPRDYAYIDGGARGNPGPAGYGVVHPGPRRHRARRTARRPRHRHEQRRRVQRPARGAALGGSSTAIARSTSAPTRSCS